jgi:phage shock protein A
MKSMRPPRLEILQAQFDEWRSEQKETKREVREIIRRVDEYSVEMAKALAAVKAEKDAFERQFRRWIAITMALASVCTAFLAYLKLS